MKRIALLACLAAWAAFSLVAWLTFDDLRGTSDSLRRARFSVVVQDMRGAVETSLDVGLRLDEVRGAQQLLERAAASDPAMLSVEVYDTAGRVVFGTDRSFVGELIPQGWLDAWQGAGAAQWHVVEEDAVVAGAPLVSSFGAIIGGIALRFTHSADEGLNLVGGWFAAATLAAGLAVGAVTAFAVAALFDPLTRQAKRLAARLSGIAPAGDEAEAAAAVSGLAAQCGAFAAALHAMQREIEDIRQAARHLDERN